MDKANILRWTFGLAALVLLLKAASIQIFNKTYQQRAFTTAIEQQVQYPARGLIYDRNGKLMVYNEAVYDLMVTYRRINPKMDTILFCNLLGIDKAAFIHNLNKPWGNQFSKNVPFPFLSKISAAKFAGYLEHAYQFPGFEPKLRITRGYTYPCAAHVLGYIGEVNQNDIEKSNHAYEQGDIIGQNGLEKTYEQELKGLKGVKYLLKDNLGREVGSYENGKLDSLAVSGYDLATSLDIELQLYAEQLFVNKVGGVVAIDPSSGEILCMTSAPSYDPNSMTLTQERGAIFTALNKDTLKPLLDRTIIAQYPPGSIFKTVVGLIALQEGVTTPGRSISCGGSYRNSGGDIRKCRDHPHPGNISIGLQFSCNSYFFTLFKDIVNKYGFNNPARGLDNFSTYLSNFGFGHKLSLEHFNEVAGFIPNSAYYNKIYNPSPWYSTAIVSLGIGQGELSFTTLQMANLAAIIANRGYYYRPHILKQIINRPGPANPEFNDKKSVRIDEIHFGPIIDGMEMVVSSGTARLAQVPDIAVCGKTGTVENPHGEDHAVFICFAPRENPKIAMAVYVENAGGGGRNAAPIAGLLIEKYLKDSISTEKKLIEETVLKTNLINALP